MCHPDVAADNRVVADGDTTQDAGVTVDGDIILDDGMTGYIEHIAISVFLEALGTQRHALIERRLISGSASISCNARSLALSCTCCLDVMASPFSPN